MKFLRRRLALTGKIDRYRRQIDAEASGCPSVTSRSGATPAPSNAGLAGWSDPTTTSGA